MLPACTQFLKQLGGGWWCNSVVEALLSICLRALDWLSSTERGGGGREKEIKNKNIKGGGLVEFKPHYCIKEKKLRGTLLARTFHWFWYFCACTKESNQGLSRAKCMLLH
jgi:hypothetical protein